VSPATGDRVPANRFEGIGNYGRTDENDYEDTITTHEYEHEHAYEYDARRYDYEAREYGREYKH
jgi:hypothetical protein